MTAQSTGGPAKRVRVIAASDLKQNGGGYVLEGRTPLAVYGVSEAETKAQGGQFVVEGNIPAAVYIVEAPSGVVTGNVPVPMIAVEGGLVAGNTAIPVYVVGGSLGGLDPVTNLALAIGNAPANDEIVATWDAVTGATLYRIRYSANGSDWTEIDTTALTTYTLTDSDFDIDAVTHYVEVRSENGGGESNWAQTTLSWRGLFLHEYFPLSEIANINRIGLGAGNVAADRNSVGTNTGKVTALSPDFIRANNEFLVVNAPSNLSFAGDFTIAGWVRPDDTTQSVFLNRLDTDGGGSSAGYALGHSFGGSSTKFQWWAGNSHGNDYNGVTFSAGTWYHVLLQYVSSTKTGGVSVNNTTLETAVSGVDAVHAGKLYLGTFLDGNLNDDGRLNGWVWYSRILSAAQKADLYNGGNGRDVIDSTTAKQIIIEGDSLSSGYSLPAGDDYPSQMMPTIGGGYLLRNVSNAGDKISEMLADIASVLALYDAARESNVLCLWGGTNDLDNSVAVATVEADYQDYCEQAQGAGFKVVAFTILPRTNVGVPGTFESERQAFNTWLRANWNSFADALADVAANTDIGEAGDSTNATYYLADEVHMTAEGYAIVGGIAAAAIAGL